MVPLIFSGALAWNSIEQRRIARENQNREATKILLQVYESASSLFSKLQELKDSLKDLQAFVRHNLVHDDSALSKRNASVAAAKLEYRLAFREYNNTKLLGLVVYGIHDPKLSESARARAKKVQELLCRYQEEVLLFRDELDLDAEKVEGEPVVGDEHRRSRQDLLVRAEMDLLDTLSLDMRYHLPDRE
ncbi:hypothetical protein [Synechococcus sp. CCAP 1479/13]|nr:hypothetical protein [Synechococcus sp. CCAP 1479/13]